MKRRIVVFILVGLFNFILMSGITFANQIMFEKDFIIKLNDDNVNNNNNSSDLPSSPVLPSDGTEYEGESISTIAKKFEKYFKKTDLEGYGEHIASSSMKKGVNPYLVGGIILVNTNCINDCSIIFKNCNNVGDLSGTPGCFGGSYKKYDSIEASVNDLVDYIYDKFVVNNLTSPSAIYKKYNKDITWAFKVSNYMEKLKKTK